MELEEPKSSKKHPNLSNTHLSNKKCVNEEKIILMFKSQMEYYLSDANLIKDKYLTDLIDKHNRKYVDVVEFLKFNKIKDIAGKNDISFTKVLPLLIKGIERSDKLKLNSLNDKVRRKDEFVFSNKLKQEISKRTIYIENLDSNVTIDQISTVFKKCGHIVSVDLPKYKDDQGKGYAFIQFSNVSNIDEALKLNNSVPKEICTDIRSVVKPLRVISYNDWVEYKYKFNELKQKLRNINTEHKPDKEYVYVKIALNNAASDTTKDQVELYLQQIDVDSFYVDIVSSHEVVVKVWDYNAYAKIESQFKEGNELLCFISDVTFLADSDFKEYLSKIKLRKDRIKRNKKSKKIKKRKSG